MFNLRIFIFISLVVIVNFITKIDAQAQPAMGIAGQAANSNNRPGQPIFGINGGGSGNNGRNWNAGGTVGVGTKVWESSNGRHSVGAGVAGSQSFGRQEGLSWRSKPNVGAGASYTYKFGK